MKRQEKGKQSRNDKIGTRLLFGPAGVPKLAARRDSEAGIARVEEVGLDCMELEFVRGVSMGEKKAAKVKAAAEKLGVSLTVHAPYYINFNSPDPSIVKASKGRLFQAARVGALCGARSVAFHPGFYMQDSPAKAYRTIKKHLREVLRRCKTEGVRIQLSPETTGRVSQFGRLDEVIALSSEIEGVLPCVDFAHLHAREGGVNTHEEFCKALDAVGRELGPEALADMHIHVSGIRFGEKGEIKHLNLADSDLDHVSLLRALKDFSAGGRLICESPDREADAIMLKKKYGRIRKKT